VANNIVGVDIGTSSLRAVEVAGATRVKPTIVRYHEVPLPHGAASAGEVLEPHTVASAFKQLWSTGGFKSKDIVLGMGNQRVIARDLVVPRAPLKQIRESLPFLMQDMLPVPVADAVLDFYPIAEVDENGPAVSGLLVAAIKEAVMGNITAARMAGLSPVHVDLIPFALTRVHRMGGPTRGTVAVVDIGESTSTVVILAGGVPEFVRIIPAGGGLLTTALAERLSITPEEAEQLKRRLGAVGAVATPEGQAAMETVYGTTRELITSVRNTLSYYISARPGRVIDRIVLSGGGAQLHGFADALAEFTRLPLTAGDPFGGVMVARGANSRSTASDRSMTVALGLALGTAA
jgi:type IV pilus assembly protein PilM